jgi:hypothetical protein
LPPPSTFYFYNITFSNSKTWTFSLGLYIYIYIYIYKPLKNLLSQKIVIPNLHSLILESPSLISTCLWVLLAWHIFNKLEIKEATNNSCNNDYHQTKQSIEFYSITIIVLYI